MELLGRRLGKCMKLIFPGEEGLVMGDVNFVLSWLHVLLGVSRVALAGCSYNYPDRKSVV